MCDPNQTWKAFAAFSKEEELIPLGVCLIREYAQLSVLEICLMVVDSR